MQNPPPQHQPPQHQPPQTQSSIDLSSRHFSYGHTPVEHRAFVYSSSQNDLPVPQQGRMSVAASLLTPIDLRPQSMLDPPDSTAPPNVPPVAYEHSYRSQDEKAPVITDHPSNSTASQTQLIPTMAMPQPAYSQRIDAQQHKHGQHMSSLSPINTDLGVHAKPHVPPTPPSNTHTSYLPRKNSMTPISAAPISRDQAHDDLISPSSREPYTPHGFRSNQTKNFHAIFSPDAAHGPNGLDFSLHQPGQIAHPNMESNRSPQWTSSLCSCSPDLSTCLTGLLCPCILYGRTSYRLSQKSAKKDPTDMLGYSGTNGHCLLMGVLCGIGWLLPMLQRTRIRHAYKLEGSLGADLLKGCCCCCCVAIQNEREVKGREEASRRWAGPASTDVYTRSAGMLYKPQR